MTSPKGRLYALLRWSERYTKTDMVYLTSSGFWLNAQVIITTLLSFALSVAFANLLSPEVYGLYQYLLACSTILIACTLSGMNYAVTSAVARGAEGVLRQSMRLQFIWSIFPFVLSLLGTAYYFYQGNTTLAAGLLLIGALTPLTITFNTYAAYLNGKKLFKESFFYALVLNLTYYPAIFLAVIYSDDPLLLLLVNLGVNAAVTAFLYWRTLRKFPPNAVTDAEALQYGKHLSFVNAAAIAVRQADSILVFHFFGAAMLALYTFAVLIPEKVGGLFKFLLPASLPKFATQTRAEIAAVLPRKLVQVVAAAAGVALLYYLVSPLLFRLVFPAYTSAISYTQIYALAIITGAMGYLAQSALISQQHKRNLYIFNIGTAAIQLVLQAGFLLLYGLWGVIAGKLLAGVLSIALLVVLVFSEKSPTSGTN
jgi:O-antigen/teichoic acid export membrane protein